MITYKFFVDNLGFSEEKAKICYDAIKNHHFSSISGILRLNEDTMLQKFNFYNAELGMDADRVLEDFRLLTYDCVSDENSPTSVRAKIKFFRDNLGFDNKDFQSTISIFSNDLNKMKDKIKFLKNNLGFEPKHIKQVPTILNYDTDTILAKANFLKKEYGFTSKQFQDYPGIFSLDFESDKPNSIKNKIKFYQEHVGLKTSHIKLYPCLLSFDTVSDETNPTSIKAKIKFYKDNLGFDNKQFQTAPNLFYYDVVSNENSPTSVRAKIKFFKDVLGYENEHFKKDPSVFGYDCISDESEPTSVRGKLKFYRDNVGITEEHIRENPILLHFDVVSDESVPTSVKAKLSKLQEIGITNEDIQNNTRLLMTPAADIKDKYALWSTIFPDKRFMELRTWFITRLEKVYARYKYLTEDLKLENLRPNYLDHCESQFIKRFKSNSDVLMDKYPLDESIIDSFYNKYTELQIEPPIQKG